MSEPLVSAGEAFATILELLEQRLDELESRVDELVAPVWMTIEEAAAHLRSTPDALRARARRGRLPGAVRDGSRWLVDRRELDASLAAVTLPPLTRQGPRRRNDRARGTRRV